jgi:aspartyl-tRNA(Asn)/glutamyl-tRNA(Gln) amidotransferase subunit C
MSLTQEQIRHIANLSRLKLSQEDIERYSKELSSIVDYIDLLNEIPESSLQKVSLVGETFLIPREDVVKPSLAPSDDILACSKQRIVGHQIGISNIMAK